MSISTLDGAIAGMQPPVFFAKNVTGTMVAGRAWSTWALAGAPGAGAFNATLNGVTLTAPQNGQIPWTNPSSGNGYLARLQGQATIPGTLLLLDRIWHNGGFTITSTSAQSITSPTWPARDKNGATLGDAILLAVEVSASTGSGTPTLTATYTNQAGTGSKTATNIVATVASSAAGSFYFLGLAAGDTGVRSVQSLQLSATWTSGTINMVAYRVLAMLELTAANTPNAVDPITGGFPRIYDGSVPFVVFIPSTTTTSNISGQVVYAHG